MGFVFGGGFVLSNITIHPIDKQLVVTPKLGPLGEDTSRVFKTLLVGEALKT
jgi:hypothetical protein